jgi:uncharacterized membrane protein (DUF4010 family)
MQAMSTQEMVIRIAVAALCGLAVGVEREWSGRTPRQHPRFAGVRTLFLLGGLAGVAGVLVAAGSMPAGVALVAGALAVVVTAYFNASRTGTAEALEATTEVAAVVVVALGVLAGLGYLALASGAAAVVVVALSEKSRVHRAIAGIGEDELRAAFHFAILALVILPILPSGSYGPLGGFRPRELWRIVLVFSGLNFLGYVARKAVGLTRGDTVAGALGGTLSSTAVTWQFSRRSREEPSAAAGLAAGVVAACTVLLPRLVVLSAILNATVAQALLPLLALPFLAGAIMVALSLLRQPGGASAAPPNDSGSPLRLWSAIRMTVAFQAALMAINLVQTRLGDQGVLVSAAVLGLTDMDALTLSMNRLGEEPGSVTLAARAIAVGVIANTILKMTLAVVLGASRYRWLVAAGLGVLLSASVGALVLFW